MIDYQLWLSLTTRDQVAYIVHMVKVLIKNHITDVAMIKLESKVNTNNDSKFMKILDQTLIHFNLA